MAENTGEGIFSRIKRAFTGKPASIVNSQPIPQAERERLERNAEELGRDPFVTRERPQTAATVGEKITITADDLKEKPASMELIVEGERVEVPTNVVIGWRDILQGEAHNPAKVDVSMPVSDKVPTEFHHAVLSHLRGDIKIARDQKRQPDNQIWRDLRVRYHPDLYRDQDSETQNLAQEYSQALGALKDNGEINPTLQSGTSKS